GLRRHGGQRRLPGRGEGDRALLQGVQEGIPEVGRCGRRAADEEVQGDQAGHELVALAIIAGMNPRHVRIDSIDFEYEDHRYRAPIKFGGVALDRATLLNVHVSVRTGAGKSATGFGSMPLGNVWSFPSRVLGYDQTLAAMKALAGKIRKLFADCSEVGHPIDIYHALEPSFFRAADEVTQELALGEPVPKLCALVVASPFDAAVHDAFGKVHGLNCYHTYSSDFLGHDLGHYLGPEYASDRLDRFVSREPKPAMPLYHLIGALDPITES